MKLALKYLIPLQDVDTSSTIRGPNWLKGDMNDSSNNTSTSYYFDPLYSSDHLNTYSMSLLHKHLANFKKLHLLVNENQIALSRLSVTFTSRSDHELDVVISPQFRVTVLKTTTLVEEDFHNAEITVSCVDGHTCPGKLPDRYNSLPYTPSIHQIQRALDDSGFHRTLRTNLEIKSDKAACSILLVEKLSESFFVDQYQVDELFKFGAKTRVQLDHVIDLEKPAYESTQNVVLTTSMCDTRDAFVECELELPLHLRYQMPSHDSSKQAIISPPTVLMKCDQDNDWNPISGEGKSNDIFVDIPVGLSDDQTMVENVTIFVTTTCAMIVLIVTLWLSIKSRNA